MPFAARGGFFAQPTAAPASNIRRVGAPATLGASTWTNLPVAVNVSTTIKQFGAGSAHLTALNAGLRGQSNFTSLNVTTGDFCIEWWIYIADFINKTNASLLLTGNNNAVTGVLTLAFSNKNGTGFTDGLSSVNRRFFNISPYNVNGGDVWELSSTWPAGQWLFCAVQRKNSTTQFWVDGILQQKAAIQPPTSAETYNFVWNSAYLPLFGRGPGIGALSMGQNVYIDDFCISNSWRYDNINQNIPIPASAFTTDEYTTHLSAFDSKGGGSFSYLRP